MDIKVRVLNYEELKDELSNKENKIDSKILTPNYVKRLNEQIAYNINKSKASITEIKENL